MKLQLRDPNFRRQMLTQLLIFLQSANATGTLSAKQRAVLVKCMSRAEVLLEKTAARQAPLPPGPPALAPSGSSRLPATSSSAPRLQGACTQVVPSAPWECTVRPERG